MDGGSAEELGVGAEGRIIGAGDGGAWMMVRGRRGRPVKDLLNLEGGWTG